MASEGERAYNGVWAEPPAGVQAAEVTVENLRWGNSIFSVGPKFQLGPPAVRAGPIRCSWCEWIFDVIIAFLLHNPYLCCLQQATVVNYCILHRCCHLVYDTIRDATLTCAQKQTWVSSIYRMEPTTKKWEKQKNQKVRNGYTQKYRQTVRVIRAVRVLKKKRKATVGRIFSQGRF